MLTIIFSKVDGLMKKEFYWFNNCESGLDNTEMFDCVKYFLKQ